MNDFERVAQIIRYLDEHHVRQPDLSELAQAAGLSESHFHRLFKRWAGATPKGFLQCLTAEHAKKCLKDSASVLEAALETGLSGPGRLHDLLVTLEAASPGEIKSGGQGMIIEWGRMETPFGDGAIAWSSRGICGLEFGAEQEAMNWKADWPNARMRRNDREAERIASEIFDPSGNSGRSLRALVRGTEFQLKVWRALLRIPEGCTATYRQIAEMVGSAEAVRAVGAACGSNPVAWLIPCHRVIRQTGVVEGYRWGSERKKAMLAMESLRARPGLVLEAR